MVWANEIAGPGLRSAAFTRCKGTGTKSGAPMAVPGNVLSNSVETSNKFNVYIASNFLIKAVINVRR